MLKLYIFDMGGVVSLNTDVSERIAERLGYVGAQWREMRHADIVALQAGSITAKEFWRRFFVVSGRRVDEDLWALYFHPQPDPEVIETIHELKSQARVVVGTNTIESHYLVHKENGDYDIFDEVYASQRIGLVKPDPAFYSYILDSEDCLPDQAAFVDDVEVNVAAARKLGIHGLLFTGADKLRRDLAALKQRMKHGKAPEEDGS
jgi:HAD superfamily hydrolase (TIGR01509 family)